MGLFDRLKKSKKSAVSKVINCPNCKSENPEEAIFCQECGEKIHSETTKEELTTDNTSSTSKQVSETLQGLGIDISQIKKDLGSDAKIFEGFVEDVNLIIGKYSSSDVENEKEFGETIKKIDSDINLKKKDLAKKLNIISSDRIQIDKIRDENKPFSITYSITLKEVESPYKESTAFFTDSDNNKTKLKVSIHDGYADGIDTIYIPDINFNGKLVQSKNDNFKLGFSDEYFVEIDGTLKPVSGQVIFIKQDELFLITDLQRPNDGKLAENGNFIINDWMSRGEFNGTFYAFNSEAKVFIKRKFNSNLGNNDISESGQYAVVEALDDKIYFFDLDSGELLWERKRDAGNIDLFEFDERENVLLISYEKDGKYRYSFKGEFLDKYKFMEERLTYANGYELFDIAKEKMDDLDYKTSDLPDYEEVLSFLVKASNKGVTSYTKARIHRVIGEIYYNYGKTDEALKNFEISLNNDPKVGLKRLYNKLKKDSNSNKLDGRT